MNERAKGEGGSRPEKLGNRYEGLWVARQLLRVVAEELRSIRVEAIGDDERGVDLWTTAKDGSRNAEQCKRDNSRKGLWTLSDLNQREILQDAKLQLERDPSYSYTLVSGVDAPDLRIIADRSRRAGSDVLGFVKELLGDAISQKQFKSLCRYWALDSSKEVDQAVAFDLLRRLHVHPWPASYEGRRDVEMAARLQASGDPRIVIEMLTAFAEDRFNEELDAPAIRSHLRSLKIELRDLAYDDRIAPRIEQLRNEFEVAGRDLLVGGSLIPRPETETVLNALKAGKSPHLIILRGTQGDGKSGVSLELTTRLAQAGTPVLPVRLDIRDPGSSAAEFGRNCGLPESLPLCLAAIAAGNSGVLLIDQLDAVRWTSAHSGAAWEAVSETLEQARRNGINVVLVCRDFDLNEDTRFKKLSELPGTAIVTVGPLPESTIDNLIRERGGNARTMSPRLRKLLRSVQRLKMWVAIERSNADFQTASDLMRAYWRHIRKEVEDNQFTVAAFDSLIRDLLEATRATGNLAASARILDRHGKLAEFLKSLGVISVEGTRVRFGHQSYLDYLVAESVADRVLKRETTLAAWIKTQQTQSLLHREQIRQSLAIIRDDSPAVFAREIESILADQSIRFHLKQVALQALGAIDEVTQDDLSLAQRLHADSKWKPHIEELVWFRHSAWINALADSGWIGAMLASANMDERGRALWLLRAVVDEAPATIAKELRKYINAPEDWPKYVAGVVQFARDPAPIELSGILFYLVKKGALLMHTHSFAALAETHPHRYLKLFAANILNWAREQEGNGPHRRPREECPSEFSAEVVEDMHRIAGVSPARVWDTVMPVLIRAAQIRNPDPTGFLTTTEDRVLVNQEVPRSNNPRTGLADLLWICVEKLSESNPREFWRRWDEAIASKDPSIRRFLVASLEFVHSSQAFAAIDRLLSDPSCFDAGLLTQEHPWTPAKNVIRKWAQSLDAGSYEKLDTCLTQMKPSDGDIFSAKRRAKEYLAEKENVAKTGLYPNSIGYSQLALLDALPMERRSNGARAVYGVLLRKFGYVPTDRYERSSTRPEPPTVPNELIASASDERWIAWIRAEYDLDGGTNKRVRSYWTPRFSVSSQLSAQTRLHPDRFAGVAGKLPMPGAKASFSTILRALSDANPPQGAPPTWKPVSPQAIDDLVRNVGSFTDADDAKTICWMIEKRPRETWGPLTVSELCRLAVEHEDPNANEDKSSEKPADRELAFETINRTRAVAIRAIGDLLFHREELLSSVKPAYLSAAADPAPSVRAAVIHAALPLLNFERDFAVDLVTSACTNTDDSVLGSEDLNLFLAYALHTHAAKLRPLLERMLASAHAPAAESAAGRITGIWLQKGLLADLASACQNGSIPERQGAAEVFSTWIVDSKFTAECSRLLPAYFSDNNVAVRRAAAAVFRDRATLTLAEMPAIANTFVESPAFLDEPGRLLFDLDQYPGSLIPYVDVADRACQAFATSLADASRDIRTSIAGDADHLAKVLLKLYDQAEGRDDVRARCLNMWDRLLEARVGMAHEMSVALDT